MAAFLHFYTKALFFVKYGFCLWGLGFVVL